MAKITKPEEKFERYDQGKTIREIEYGVLFPDGTIVWESSMMGKDFSNEQIREKYVQEWNENLARHHALSLRSPIFVRREKKTSFSEVTHLS